MDHYARSELETVGLWGVEAVGRGDWGTAVSRVLYVVVCAAGPAGDVGKLVSLAQDDGWQVYVIATPAARAFIDERALAEQTGRPVLVDYRSPKEPRRAPPADAIIVAPATFNTINKLAAGIADNYALATLAECIGAGVPVVVLPFINSALAGRAPLRAAVRALRDEGVRVLLGPDGYEPHPPRAGGDHMSAFPWALALTTVSTATRERTH